MKKISYLFVVLLLLVSCSHSDAQNNVITVGATIVPHAEILEQVKAELEEAGYQLKIVEYTDYVQPNKALESGDLDANYFQHTPYLENFNQENNTDLVALAKIHYEPFGLYQGNKKAISELEAGDKISVPNDTTNEARALGLLEQEGLIKLNPDAGLNATILDITDNPLNLEIIEIEAAQLAKSIDDVAFSVINGNYALQEGLTSDVVVAFESKDSVGADTFANVIAVREDNKDTDKIKALVKALQSDVIRDFITQQYDGAVEVSF